MGRKSAARIQWELSLKAAADKAGVSSDMLRAMSKQAEAGIMPTDQFRRFREILGD